MQKLRPTLATPWHAFFETYSQHEGWDGTYKGELVRPGVYIYNLEVISDTEVVFLFQENNDFSYDEMLPALKISGCEEVFVKSATDRGDIFLGLDDEARTTLIYSTGDNPDIDNQFINDGFFESGSVMKYLELFRNEDLQPGLANSDENNPKPSLKSIFSRLIKIRND